MRVFHISFSWWFFIGVWVTANLLKSLGLFSVFWLFSIVWTVSSRPPTSKFSSPFNNPLVTILKAPIMIGIIVTFMYYSLFNSLTRWRYLSFFLHSFRFILWSKSTFLQVLFLFSLIIIRSVFWPRLGDPFVCQGPIEVYVCHFLGQMLGCAYTICLYGQI